MTSPTKKRYLERGFQTYGDAHAYFRRIVKDHLDAGFEPGWPIGIGTDRESWELYKQLHWLLDGDPDFETKTSGGIVYFTLHRPYAFDKSKIGFAVVNKNGELHHFSVRICLGQVPRRTNVSNAFKAEIAPELERARKLFSTNRAYGCPETGETLTEPNTALDYLGPGFKQILERFLQLEVKEMRAIELDDDGIVDRALATRWQAYFAAMAKLVGVSKRGLKLRNERRKKDPFWEMTT